MIPTGSIATGGSPRVWEGHKRGPMCIAVHICRRHSRLDSGAVIWVGLWQARTRRAIPYEHKSDPETVDKRRQEVIHTENPNHRMRSVHPGMFGTPGGSESVEAYILEGAFSILECDEQE
jgi:hypothetical protein